MKLLLLKKFVIFTITFLLMTNVAKGVESNTSADLYGPPVPAGFVEQKTWWSKVKTKISEVMHSFGSKAEGSKPRLEQSDQIAKDENGREWKYSGISAQSIEVHQTITQPALKLSRNVQIAALPSLPQIQFKQKKEVPVLEPLSQAVPALKSKKYELNPQKDKALDYQELSSSERKINTKLVAHDATELRKIDPIHRDTYQLMLGLVVWLFNNQDEAIEKIHSITLKTQASTVKEKSLAFEAWILEEKDMKYLASIYLSKALDSSSFNAETSKYDNWILSSLSDYSKSDLSSKRWAKQATLENLLKSDSLTFESKAFATLVLAERAFDKKSYQLSRKIAQAVPAKTSWKEQARYLAAIDVLAQNDSKENLESAGRELTELFRTVEDQAVFDATATTLGRIHFILGNYKAAHEYLSQVSKETNIYIEAAVDNGWALLRAGDRNHAVGNMFTLHTPYFDGAYMPESYFLQSLGYQELCQFGDAMTSIKLYKNRYAQAYKTLIDFNAKNKKVDGAYYDDLVSYLSHKDSQMAGIILRELGRNPDFIKRQKTLNNISKDQKRVAEVFPKSATPLTQFADASIKELREKFRVEIGEFLKHKALTMEDELKFLTANLSLLEYEIYAGASNNLALQGAQNFAVDEKTGGVPKREFEENKEFWPYEQEIWEDELNNFRSKIVDGCARVKTANNQ